MTHWRDQHHWGGGLVEGCIWAQKLFSYILKLLQQVVVQDDCCTSSFHQLFLFSASVVTTCCQSQVGSSNASCRSCHDFENTWPSSTRCMTDCCQVLKNSGVRVCRRCAGFCLFLFTCLLAVGPSEFDVCERSFSSTVGDINQLLGWNFSLQVWVLGSCQSWFTAHTLPVYFTPHGHTLSPSTTERKISLHRVNVALLATVFKQKHVILQVVLKMKWSAECVFPPVLHALLRPKLYLPNMWVCMSVLEAWFSNNIPFFGRHIYRKIYCK